ncbi:MAG: L,D-transpeptidase family protein [Sphingomicrobium sp.]
MKRLIEFLLLACATSAAAQPLRHRDVSVLTKAHRLNPGQFVWEPRGASTGPLFLVINLGVQRVVLYRNGVPIAASTISTGARGRETPTGVFTILQKEVVHRSRTYDDAPMPYMQRLTWKGVAMHGGHLPGYPASHGCIRLPRGFAKLLYGVTRLGTPVMITDGSPNPGRRA